MTRLLSGLKGWPSTRSSLDGSGVGGGGPDEGAHQLVQDARERGGPATGKGVVLLIGDEEQSEHSFFPEAAELAPSALGLAISTRLSNALQIYRQERVEAIVLETEHLTEASLARLDYVAAWDLACPLIVVYGDAHPDQMTKAFEAGADEVLPRHRVRQGAIFDVVEHAGIRHRKMAGRQAAQQTQTAPPFHIVQEMHEGMVIIDREGIVRFVNDPVCRLLRQTPKDLIGKPFPYPLHGAGKQAVDLTDDSDAGELHAELRVIDTEWGGYPARLVSLQDVTARTIIEQEIAKATALRETAERTAQAIRQDIRDRILVEVEAATSENRQDADGLKTLLSDLRRTMTALETRLRTASH